MNPNSSLINLRTKKIGLLMLDARQSCQEEVAECALSMGVTPRRYRNFELGKVAPSLPELEALAYFLDVPIDHFWGKESLSEKDAQPPKLNANSFISIRQRIIGLHLRTIREEKGIKITEIAEVTGITESKQKRFENGAIPISIPELEALCSAMQIAIETFYTEQGAVGDWHNQHEMIQKFLSLSPEIQKFVCLPVNRPYLDLAMRLSSLSVDRLRTVAEGLLEITY